MEGSYAVGALLLDLMTITACQDVELTRADYELTLSCTFQGQAFFFFSLKQRQVQLFV